jgi:hypothetical protein
VSTENRILICYLREPVGMDLLLARLAEVLGVGSEEIASLLDEGSCSARVRVELHRMERGFRSYISLYGWHPLWDALSADLDLALALARATGMDAATPCPGTLADWWLARPDGTTHRVRENVAPDGDDVVLDETSEPDPLATGAADGTSS